MRGRPRRARRQVSGGPAAGLSSAPPGPVDSAPPPAGGAARDRRLLALAIGLVVLAALAVTANALHNAFILDDASKIVDNPDLRDLGALGRTLVYPYDQSPAPARNDPSRPLVFLVYALLYACGGARPAVFHAANAVVHALAGALVLLLGRRVARLSTGEDRIAGPLIAGLVFVVAPIQVGTATYAYGLSDLLAASFTLGSLLLFTRERRPSRAARAATVAAMVLALSAKQTGVIVPLVILLFDLVLTSELDLGALRPRLWLHAPHFAVAALYLVLRAATFGAVGDLEGRGHTLPALGYLLVQPAAIVRYLWLTLVPSGLAIDHDLSLSSFSAGEKALGFAFVAAAAYGALRLARRGTAPARWALFALGLYFIALGPTSSFLPTVDVLVERRVYLANAAVALVPALLYEHAGALGWGRRRPAMLALVGVWLSAMIAVSLHRNAVYRTNESAWRDVLTLYPESWRAENSLATAALARGDWAAAREGFERLVARDPDDFIALGNLGAVYGRSDSPYLDPEKAMALYRRAIALNPADGEARYNLGRLYQIAGRASEAVTLYREAIERTPSHVLAHNNLGVLYMRQGKLALARREYEAALRIDPSCEEARDNRELLLRAPAAPPASSTRGR